MFTLSGQGVAVNRVGDAQEFSSALRWARGLASHVLAADVVALLSERGSHALRGRTYAAISPLIDGQRTADDVAAAVGSEIPAANVYFALLKLQKLGLLVADGARSAVIRAAPDVVVVGLPDGVGDDFRTRIPDLEKLSDGGSLITVALTDDYLRPEIEALATAVMAAGASLLPVRPVGRLIWAGPLLRPGSERLLQLLLERIRLNRRADVLALEQGAAFPLVPIDTSPASLSLGLALGGALAATALGDDDSAGIGSALLTFDRESFDLTRHPIADVTEKPQRNVPDFADVLAPVDLQPARKVFTADGGHRVTRPEDTLARLDRVVSSITGVVSPPLRLTSATILPVYRTSYVYSPALGAADHRLQPMKGAAGKGISDAQARASCTAEAVERYSCAFFGDEPRRRARLADIADIAVDPRDLLLFSDEQYAVRPVDAPLGFNFIPAPFDPSKAIEWTPMISLATGRTRWVPAAHCFFGYRDVEASAEPFEIADSNGCAAGNTVEEAILQGLLELVERDAIALWWYSRTRRAEVDLDSFADPVFARLMETYSAAGQELHVLDLTVDTGVPVVAAVRWRRGDGGGIDLGFGAHLDPHIAVARALSEVEQSQFDVEDVGAKTPPDIAAWRASATIANQPYVVPSSAPTIKASGLVTRTFTDLRDDVDWCVELLSRLGHDVLVYEHTRPDVGFPVVRVVAPGLRHFWKRLAPGRLYDVPVQLGLVSGRLSEAQMNPIGMFL